ncbi:hypothetical protein CDAR_240241 [Caerostris darwini]|uniref:Uncharacterized protein n=1 Tax=Caerostris darwini TaxID=1538125 RepID=A0AAV4QHB6_9ARAC|nr:hypothetical protein CDAR_240241 [Caerostris darwini]
MVAMATERRATPLEGGVSRASAGKRLLRTFRARSAHSHPFSNLCESPRGEPRAEGCCNTRISVTVAAGRAKIVAP